MILSKETLSAYNESRNCANKKIVCHAPFVNLNFAQSGEVRACCYNNKHILGKWPEQSLKDIWFGSQIKALQQFILKDDLGGGCIECGKMLDFGNHQGVKARFYDNHASYPIVEKVNNLKHKLLGGTDMPKVMEFELTNECNLECVMCTGYFSSSIRKNREKLPPIISPYNDDFVNELDAFIPYLTDAKFLGGEPFMMEIYLKIWERILKIKPSIRIHITTNGTFLNNRIKDLLEGLNAGIIISIDSVEKDTYKKIRVNGNLEKVMENLVYFMDYTKRKKTFISIAACPMTNNWRELPQLLDFCIERNITLYFNVVFYPFELSLKRLSSEKLTEIISFLEQKKLPAVSRNQRSPLNLSIRAYLGFIQQLRGWVQEKKGDNIDKATAFISADDAIWSLDKIREVTEKIILLEENDFPEEKDVLKSILKVVFAKTPQGEISNTLCSFVQVTSKHLNKDENVTSIEKIKKIAELIESRTDREQILHSISQAPPVMFLSIIEENDINELANLFIVQFGMKN